MRFLVLLLLISLSTPAFAAEDYAFLLKARGNAYWQAMAEGIEDAAKVQKIKATVYQLSTDSAAEEQLNQCQAVIAKRPRAMVIAAVTPAIGIACMKEAQTKGITVADMDANVAPGEAKKQGVDMAFTVGSDNYRIGSDAADYLTSATKRRNIRIFILEGAAGNIAGKNRVQGFKDRIAQQMPESAITGSISAEWDRMKAMNAVSDALQRDPAIDAIYAANDMMALGAVEALRANGRKNVIVIGVDGVKGARDSVIKGEMSATVAQIPYYVGKRAVEKLFEKDTKAVEITPTPVLTKKVLEVGKDPLLQYVR